MMMMSLFAPIMPVETISLRDYQIKAVDMARISLAKHKKIVLMLPTGSGKTFIGAYMLKKAANKGLSCCFCVETIALIDQTVETLAKYGMNCGVIQGQHPLYAPDEPIQVASVQTLARRKHQKFDFLIIDEAHVLHEYHETLIDEADYVVGLSATPYRKSLGKHFNDLIQPVKMRWLIDNGFLVDFKVYGPNTISTEGLGTRCGDFIDSELAERADTTKITGDIVDHWMKHAKGRKTICFCVNIAHGKHVAREFNRRGIEAVQVNAYQDSDGKDSERSQVMDSFTKGTAQVICSVGILGRGFDFPEASCAILARPTKSLMIHQQQVGRVLRIGGHHDALILDHAGNHERLGFVDEISINTLDKGDKGKGSSEPKEKDEPLPKACPSCDYLKPVGVKECPACGFEPENIKDVEVEDGELAELKRTKKDRKEYTLADKQAFLAGLNAYAASKGMKRHFKGFYGWSLYRYSDKFGCKPSSKMDWAAQGIISEEVRKYITHGFIKTAKSKPQPCKECGGTAFDDVPVNNVHKVKKICRGCGGFIKWGS